MYTFQDWLENKPLSDNYPNRDNHFHRKSISLELLVIDGEMTRDELMKVRQAQEWTYDKSLEINLKTFKELFKESLSKSLNPKKLVNHNLKNIKKQFKNFPDESGGVLRGDKYYCDILPKHYLKLKENSGTQMMIRVNNHSWIEYQLLAEKWIKELKKNRSYSQKSNSNTEQNRTKDLIKKKFESMDFTKGWKYAFKTEDDYCTYLILLVDYFEQKEYSLPDKVISLQRRCKTKVAQTLNEIYKELDVAEAPLKSNTKFLELVKVLKPFTNDPNLYKTLTR